MATQEDGARIGDRCRTLTALRPSGKVAVAGVEFEARSEGQWIDPERDCVVVSGDDRGLIVRAVEKDSPIPALANHGAPALEGRLKGKTCLRCDAQLGGLRVGLRLAGFARRELLRRLLQRLSGLLHGGLGALVALLG